ncbi:RNA-binding protein 24-like isoform X1 [Carica papaya]|uniref:RNA-binding protein 24-like isoform X1 n=1 Tax=Carica papaya TaxID=3649 RepID=UPI000B8CE339|nr:RNA-binding protein 24-like isoform X1 [Carica papaya]
MSQQRHNKIMANETNTAGDTTFTKIFVGGLAWETKRDAVRGYFEQFGEIVEAVVIHDKNTGRSKGYGFVTFKDADSALRACQNPYPVIDGRRANCNIASLGAQKNRPQQGMGKFGPPAARSMAPSTLYFRQPTPPYALPYTAYGYPGYPQDMYAMDHYNIYGGQQLGTYPRTGSPGFYLNYYYPLYAQTQATSGPTMHPRMIQYPYFSRALGLMPLPPTPTQSLATIAGASAGEVLGGGSRGEPAVTTDQKSSQT